MMPGGPWHLSKNVTELQWPWVRSPCGLNTTDLPLLLASRRSRSLTSRFRSQRYTLLIATSRHSPCLATCMSLTKTMRFVRTSINRKRGHTHHVHLVVAGGDNELKTLAFRDFLRDHPEVAREYESLKRHLSSRYDAGLFASQQAYAEAKGSFIAAVTEQAVARGYPRTVTTP